MSETILHPNPSQVRGMKTKAPLGCQVCSRVHKNDPEFRQHVSISGSIIVENGISRAEVACLRCGHHWLSSHPQALAESRSRYPVPQVREELFGATRKLMDGMIEVCEEALRDSQPMREAVKGALRYAQRRGYYLTRRGR